jgi:phage/plasmid-like protein (TIGR03299 family)
MAHELDIRNGVAAMAYVGEVPWHGLGQALPPGLTIEEWQAAAGMDWEIKRAMVRYPLSSNDASNPDSWVALSDRHVLSRSDVRDETGFLGIVSDKYEVVQPKAVLEFFRDLTSDAGFTLETAGVLFNGRQFWALARVTEDAAIRDKADKVGGFLLLSTSADGTLATEGRWTTTRVVCNNTLSAARSFGKKSAVKMKHRSVFDGDALKASLGVSAHEARANMAKTMDDFRRLANRKVTALDRARMTMELFGHDPDELVKDKKELARVVKSPTFSKVADLSDGGNLMGADLSGGSETAWGWLNAVTQYYDHHQGRGDRNVRLSNAWFGEGDAKKTRAYEIALEYAGIGGGQTVTHYAPGPDDDTGGGLLDAVLANGVG